MNMKTETRDKVKLARCLGVSIGASLLLWGVIIYAIISLTGCAGIELYSAVGMKRVDEYESRQATRREETKPLKCLFVDCSNHNRVGTNFTRGEK